ncbi:MAG TPA: SdpI family protein [bacterium]|nr:SdpI family protein [bacterium]
MRKIYSYLKWIAWGLMVVSGWYFYNKLPAIVPTHWNLAGEADGFGSKTTHLILMPVIVLGMMIMLMVLPKLDPKKEKYEKFAEVYELFQLLLAAFMSYTYLVTIWAGLNPKVDVGFAILAGIGLLFVAIGNYMGKIRQNYFVGIKTPWTLDNEEVWNKTHRLGGWCFVLAGLMFLVQAFLAWKTWWVLAIALTVILAVPIGYSYWLHKQLKK